MRLRRRPAHGRAKGAGTPAVEPLEEPVEGAGGGRRAERAARVRGGAAARRRLCPAPALALCLYKCDV